MPSAVRSFLFVFAMFLAAVTPAAAQQEVTLLREGFDEVVLPALPAGWAASADGWVTDDGVSSGGSGGGNLYVKGSSPARVTTPLLDLTSATAATFSYLARRTGTYAADSLRVTASTDGGATFPLTLLTSGEALPEASSSYELITATLPVSLLGAAQVVLRFEALGGSSGSANVRIDDVTVRGTVDGLFVAPSRLAFSAQVGETQTLEVTAANYGRDDVQIDAPQVTGAAFAVAPAGGVTIASGDSVAYAVSYTPAAEGPHGGTLLLAYGSGETTIALEGATIRSEFGFAAAADTVVADSQRVDLPLTLDFGGPEALQSLQFTVSWDDPSVQLAGLLRGAAVSDERQWTLSYHAVSETEVNVVLMAEDGGLTAGNYEPLLLLQVDTGPVEQARDVVFALSGVVGALAVPTGDDAGISVGQAAHALTLEQGRASFGLSRAALNFGTTEVGAAQAMEVIVSNAGNRELRVSEVERTNPLFTAAPASAVVPAGGQQVFAVSFAPEMGRFGYQTDTLTFVHDGEAASEAQVAVVGTGIYGRGDTDGNGMVEVVDLVQLIDFVLERTAPEARQAPLADLFPFGTGDDELDVRDLTVLAQAITRGRWPDDGALPVEYLAEKIAPLQARQVGKVARPVTAYLAADGPDLVVELEHARPLRAVQLVLQGKRTPGPPSLLLSAEQVTAMADVDASRKAVRLLLFRADGEPIPPGRYAVARLPSMATSRPMLPLYAAAIGIGRERLAVEVLNGSEAPQDEPLPTRFDVGAPYPHPFAAEGLDLRIPVDLPEAVRVEAAVFDLVGRRVAVLAAGERAAGRFVISWDGRAASGQLVDPGMYVVRIRAGDRVQSRPLVVVR